jgi:hypothetical protein
MQGRCYYWGSFPEKEAVREKINDISWSII